MNAKFLLGSMMTIPLLPLMYFQGRQIRARVPSLPEASNPQGYVDHGCGRQLHIAILGESTMAGVGVRTHEEGFAGSLANELSVFFNTNIKWTVYAQSGYTARDVNEKIVPLLRKAKLDLIVIGLGGNDAFSLNTPSKWSNDIRSLIRSIRSKYPNTSIVFTNMPPIKEFPAFTSLIKFSIGNLVKILGQELSKVIKKERNIYYENSNITFEEWILKNELSNIKSDFFSDGVHPSKLTYQIWAKEMAQFIQRQNVLTKSTTSLKVV